MWQGSDSGPRVLRALPLWKSPGLQSENIRGRTPSTEKVWRTQNAGSCCFQKAHVSEYTWPGSTCGTRKRKGSDTTMSYAQASTEAGY